MLVVLSVLVGFGAVLVLPATAAGAAEHNGSGDGSDVSVTRYGGADRYETSLQVAEAVAADADGSLEWVVLVSGRRWTDAVVAAPVAGALGAPVLMTPPGELRADALGFLQRVGISKALVVGPDASGGAHGSGRGVEAGVLEALGEAGITAERVAGDDLYGTGVAAAGRVTPGVMGDRGRTAVIASGEVFADALVAGPFAARGIHPVLLSPPGELHAEVAAYLGDAGITHVVLMGGTSALSDAVEQSVEDLGIEVSRVAGSTRYDTAVQAAELAEGRYNAAAGKPCFAKDTIGVARARVPFDSFSAAPLLGRLCAPLVLADPDKIPDDTAAYLDVAREAHDAVGLRVFGGDAAVSQAAIDAYLTGTEPDTGDDDNEAEDDQASAAPGVLPAGICGGAIDDEPTQLVPSTNAEDPAWSPDCSRLVYTQDGSLWTVNNDGTDARKLVDYDGLYSYAAVWSPDGSRVAYSRGQNDENGNWVAHIWTVNVDGSHNNQRTEGDVIDRWPTWSPDGKWLAFERETGSGRDEHGHLLGADRHIVVMTSYGNKPRALNEGGAWEGSPAWSPDGSQLAYQTNSLLVVSDTDGSNARRLHAGVYFDGGMSWSPDGTRIAFTRGGGAQTSIVIADIDGIDEAVIFDEGILTLAPRWSPDGQRIAFHTIDTDGKHRTYVAGASGEPAGIADDCRPRGVSGVTAGFPLPDWAPSATGTLRVAVLFVDFPGAQATHTVEEEAALGLPWAEEYLEAVSYGKVDVQFVSHHEWLRAPHSYSDYFGENGADGRLLAGENIGSDVVELVDDEIDFSGFHSLAVILPSTHFGGGIAGGNVEADGVSLPRHINNFWRHDEPGEPRHWGSVAAHELVHNLGLLDLYPYDDSVHERPAARSGHEWVAVEWGRMNMWAWYLSPQNDPRRQVLTRFPGGGTSSFPKTHLSPQEMLSWSRWQLGWLDDTQIRCLSDAEAEVTLSPIEQPGDGIAMVALQLSSRDVIVIESRRKLGYDQATDYTASNGARTTSPNLIEEGVLVYTVDTLVPSGELPMRVAGDSGNGQVDGFPVLGPGESVTLHGYTITVTADDGDTHTVSITRDN